MNKVILTVGVPGSGKSTWAKEYVANIDNNAIRVSKDELRQMLNTVLYDWRNERFIDNVMNEIVRQGLEDGYTVIIDNMNLSKKHYNHWKTVADIEIKIFDPGLDICIERDKLRERCIGEKRIRELYEVFERNWK